MEICIISSLSSNRLENQNQAQDQAENLVDTPDDTEKQEESIANKNIENQARNYNSRRLDDTDDTLHINGKEENNAVL